MCPKKELTCSYGSKFPRSAGESHARQCPKRPINCDYCGTSVPCDVIEVSYLITIVIIFIILNQNQMDSSLYTVCCNTFLNT